MRRTIAKVKRTAFFVPAILLLIAACSKDHDAATITVNPPPDTSLQKLMPFRIGAAVSVSLLQNNAKYNALVIKEYNSITPENAMKFASVHTAQNTFNFTDADWLVNFAQFNNKRVHGHNLIWHQSLPNWVINFSGDSAAWENLMKTHIQTVVAHFKGKLSSWDVVNEAFDDNGVLRNSVWLQHLGKDFIARCFQYAHEADPDVLLFYNDYGNEYSAAKRTAIAAMLSSFKSRGIPIDGIGMQFHTQYKQSDANISAAITAAAATGLRVHISELDIAMNPDNLQGLALTTSLEQQQADKYASIVKMYHAIPVAQQYGITTWNVGDADSWIPSNYKRPDWPLPFDSNYLRKPAYYAILNAVK